MGEVSNEMRGCHGEFSCDILLLILCQHSRYCCCGSFYKNRDRVELTAPSSPAARSTGSPHAVVACSLAFLAEVTRRGYQREGSLGFSKGNHSHRTSVRAQMDNLLPNTVRQQH